jgi:putative ABC transport system permease protein
MTKYPAKKHRALDFLLRLVVTDRCGQPMAGDLDEIFHDLAREKGRFSAWIWLLVQLATTIPTLMYFSILWSIDMIRSYLVITLRHLRHNKTFSLLNILGLTIGLTACLMIAQYISFETSYDDFHKNGSNLYRVQNDRIYEDRHDKSSGCPPAAGPALKDEFPEILDSARLYTLRYFTNVVTYEPSGREPVSVTQDKMYYAEGSFLRMCSFPLLEGSAQTALREPKTAVITSAAARRIFGDEDPLGKVISVSNSDGLIRYTITAVAADVPENTHIKFSILLSYPTLVSMNEQAAYYWGWNMFNTYLLLAPGTDPAALETKFAAFCDKQKLHSDDYKRRLLLQPIDSIHLHSQLRHEPEVNGDAKTVRFLAILGVFILVIAWVNYINLSTARAVKRAREVGVRKVLGSERIQLIKQFLFESGFFNFMALILAVILTAALLPRFSRSIGKVILLDPGVVWIWLGACFLLGVLLSGFYPALVLSSFQPVTVLKGVFGCSSKGAFLRKGLVVFQFSISIFLIASAAVVFRQIRYMQQRDLGIDIEQTLVLKVPQLTRAYPDRKLRFKQAVLRNPAIHKMTTSTEIPGRESASVASGFRPLDSPPESATQGYFINVDYDYFDFFNLKILAGRSFFRDFSTDPEKILINQEAVRRFGYAGIEEALNQNIFFGGLGGETYETIGVVNDYHFQSLRHAVKPLFFLVSEWGSFISLKLDTAELPRTLAFTQQQWEEVFPGTPFEYFFLDEIFNLQYQSDRRFGRIFALFTLLAITIACLGLFGLAVFVAEQRTKEIGIRKILGASVQNVVFLLSRDFLKWVVLSNLIAWPAAYFVMSRWLQQFAYHTGVSLPILLGSGVLALVIAMLTISLQAVRAAISDPVRALRYE